MNDMGTIAAQPTDAELVEASRRGEHAAFGHLVERYQGVVCAVSYSSTGDRVLSEDVAQETFIAAWRQLHQLRETVRLRSWLCGIARNLGRKARRRSGRETLVESPPAVRDEATPFDATSEAQAEAVVKGALDRVPETYREVLVLYYRENRSAKEVAAALGLSEANVLQRLARGRQYLADGLADLVERSLAAPSAKKPARDLRAGVLAAIPAIPRGAGPHVQPLTSSSGGWTMIKLALAAAAVAAAGTTAYVVATKTDAAPANVAAVAPAPAPLAMPAPARATAPSPVERATGPGPALPVEQLPPNLKRAPDPDDVPVVDDALIERTRLYDGPSQGPADAPVTIVVFTDLKCTYCGVVLGTVDQLVDEYPKQLRLVVKQFPVHDTARLAAEAALAAQAQGRFWEMHDLMMQNQTELERDHLVAYARQAKLDVPAFERALDEHQFAAALAADEAAGKAIDIQATPSFLVNGRRFVGALPIEQFRAAIDEELERVGKLDKLRPR
jgi:RNA polymerase sigma factor (sigma-70 family)